METVQPITEPNMLKHTTTPSPDFIGIIEPTLILEKLDAFCEQLRKNPSDETIESINHILKSWQIITIEHGSNTHWITVPLVIRKTIIRRSLFERISHAIVSYGEWQCEMITRNSIEGEHQLVVPLNIYTNNEDKNAIMNDTQPSLLFALIFLRRTMHDILVSGASTIGIFEKPHGVINQNRLRTWFDDNENTSEWTMKHSLNVTSIYSIIDGATFTVSK